MDKQNDSERITGKKIEESLIDLQAARMRDNLIIVGILEQAEETKEVTLTTHNPEAATTLGRHY